MIWRIAHISRRVTPTNDFAAAMPGLAIAFPLEGRPKLVGSGGADADLTLVRRIVVGLDDDWRELLLQAAELTTRTEVRAET